VVRELDQETFQGVKALLAEHPELTLVRLRELVEASRELESFRAWGNPPGWTERNPSRTGSVDPRPPLPPLVSSQKLAAALSSVAGGDGDSRLPLRGMSGRERHNGRSSGGRDEGRFNHMRGGGEA
jgi:hypothetical protein